MPIHQGVQITVVENLGVVSGGFRFRFTLPNSAVAGRVDSEKSFWDMKVGSLILMSSR